MAFFGGPPAASPAPDGYLRLGTPVQIKGLGNMFGKSSGELSQLLLALYRLSLEQPLDEFQDAALALLRTRLPFDSSMWGTATHTPAGIDIHTIHLNNQPTEMLEGYEAVKHLDTAAVAVSKSLSATLAFNAEAWFSERYEQALLDYGKKFEQRNFFITSSLDPDTRFTHWVTLFRAHSNAYGTEQESRLLGALAPHLRQALEHNRILHLGRLKPSPQAVAGAAIADMRGLLYHADTNFVESIRQEWGNWVCGPLPPALLNHFSSGQQRFSGRAGVITCRVERELLFLHSRPRQAFDDLTTSEYAVALLVAKGRTHKEVAKELGRAPSTVRNQNQAVYGKLNVSNVAGLIDQMHFSKL